MGLNCDGRCDAGGNMQRHIRFGVCSSEWQLVEIQNHLAILRCMFLGPSKHIQMKEPHPFYQKVHFLGKQYLDVAIPSTMKFLCEQVQRKFEFE